MTCAGRARSSRRRSPACMSSRVRAIAPMLADATGTTLPVSLRHAVAERAAAVDAGAESPRRALRELATAGLLTLGLPGRGGTIAVQAAVLAELAEVCMATAFCAWGHRMTLEYLATAGGDTLDSLAELRLIGSSAMAGAFRAAAGLAPLSVRGRRDGGSLVLSGHIPWASNLYADSLALLAADVEGEGPRILAVPVATPGVDVRPARGLLALEATASGQLLLERARVATAAVHPEPFEMFVARVQRPFLVLQSALCLGLARAARRPAASGSRRVCPPLVRARRLHAHVGPCEAMAGLTRVPIV